MGVQEVFNNAQISELVENAPDKVSLANVAFLPGEVWAKLSQLYNCSTLETNNPWAAY